MSKKTSINLTTRVTHGNKHVVADIEGEVVMMSIQQGHYYSLDAMGSRIWELIEQPCLVTTICDTLLKEFEVNRETCEREVLAFLQELAQKELIKVVNEIL